LALCQTVCERLGHPVLPYITGKAGSAPSNNTLSNR
jgi:hypothetical protein